jgi:2-keto-4-pentenoate hydratase/2-oxohepta-3-ene-1,7-dioic acid hydratase in catechol pathway
MALLSSPSRTVICAGLTHPGHQDEAERMLAVSPVFRERPCFFVKPAASIVQERQPIILPDVSRLLPADAYAAPFGQVTGEVELAIIIGQPGHRIEPASAWNHIAGFSVFNDVSQRDMQRAGYPISVAKGFRSFGPLGPGTVGRDQAPDIRAAAFQLRVNGVARQEGNLGQLLYPLEELISLASHIVPLQSGDVVTTGSPTGVLDYAFAPGDLVEAEIEQVGTLTNPVIGERT